jgi:hypothetical protein
MAEKSDNGMSKLLLDLRADLMQGRIEEEFSFASRTFRIHTLSDDETVWVYQYVTMASTLAMAASRRASTLAVAVSHIDGNPVESLFNLPTDPKLLGFLENSPEEKKSYFREKMYSFFSDLPDRVVVELFFFYEGLEKRREEVIQNLKGSSPQTTTLTSNSTSLPDVGAQIPGGSFAT